MKYPRWYWAIIWIIGSSCLILFYTHSQTQALTSFIVNLILYLIFRIIFFNAFRKKRNNISKEFMILTTLQMLFFLSFALMVNYTSYQFLSVLNALWVFLGLLTLQVFELIGHLKTTDKSFN